MAKQMKQYSLKKDASYETTSAKRLRELSEDSKLESLVAKNPVTTSIG